MAETKTCKWMGKSGDGYKYYIYPIGTKLEEVPGNYIFAKESSPRKWSPVYIGQTSDLDERFDNHHKMPCINRNGATHIHAHRSSSDEKERRKEETDLIANYSPPCNG